MNYAGFTAPVWAWLRGDELPAEPATSFSGSRSASRARRRSRSSRRCAHSAPASRGSVLHSWALLDSHDIARFRDVAGSRERQLVGVGLQMTTPGVPMVFAGDEIGLEGEWGEDARRTMPWARPETWDHELLDGYRRADRAAPLEPRARARRHPLRARLAPTRSRTCARRAASACSASPRAATHEPVRLRSPRSAARELETLSATTSRSTATRSSCRPRPGLPRLENRVTTEEARMAEVQFKEVDKVYENDVHAVQDLSLDIEDGEFLVLVGPSGCGKTTALRMVAGLEDITDGTISIGDRVVNDLTPKERDIAMVFQNYALYPHLSRRGQHRLRPAAAQDAEGTSIDERVAWAAKLLDLTPYLARKPKELSGGQRQRVAMGRAIVREPQVFLMDEPLSNLDAKLRVQMRAEIAQLQHELGTTTIYVTHDQVEAMTMGDRVAVMSMGVLQQVDTPAAALRRAARTSSSRASSARRR